jgi:uncharacterized protein YbjT (DUF2867 family)
MQILVVGAGGYVGSLACAALEARGHLVTRHVRGTTFVKSDAIVNCAGASVLVELGHGWRGYRAVDTPIGLACVEAARAMDARLVYVGAAHPPGLRRCAYIDAHERVAEAMRAVDGVVVRSTGLYVSFASLLRMARRGFLVDVGDGRARTNPLAEHDLATVIATCVEGSPRDVAVGGPETMTRGELFEQVAAAAGRRVRIIRVPAWLGAAGATMLRLVHPRIGQFVKFGAGLAKVDAIAPAVGTTTLRDYLARLQ